MPSITALLPAYNERLQAAWCFARSKYADRRPRDDGSSDSTAEVASLAIAEHLKMMLHDI
jgi:hypothetical protein